MEYLQLSLREAAKFDEKNGLAQQLTAWGKICKERADQPYTRKSRVLKNKEKRA